MAFLTVTADAETAEHVHAFDEWFVVVAGAYVKVGPLPAVPSPDSRPRVRGAV